MNEYLINAGNGLELVESEIVPLGSIRVPFGAEIAILSDSNICYFYKNNGNTVFHEGIWRDCAKHEFYTSFEFMETWGFLLEVIWQRKTTNQSKAQGDAVNPSHYKNGTIECINAIESATVNKAGLEAVCTANVIKYLWRYENKNGLEDIKKACWYLDKLINHVEEILKTKNGDENE